MNENGYITLTQYKFELPPHFFFVTVAQKKMYCTKKIRESELILFNFYELTIGLYVFKKCSS